MKIALVSPDAITVWLFRKGLIKRLIHEGHSVFVICKPDNYWDQVKGLGVICKPIDLGRFISPLKDIKLLIKLYILFRKERFDIVHNFTPKPNIFGSIAASLAGCETILGMVEGLGFVFSSQTSVRSGVLLKVLSFLYTLAFSKCNRVCFANADDMEKLISMRLIKRNKTILIKSAGIDLQEFCEEAIDLKVLNHFKEELRVSEKSRLVIMASRLVWSKGVAEFIEAAEIINQRYCHVKFILVGNVEKDSSLAVPNSYIEKKQNDYLITLGFRDELRELISLSDIVVLPSYYGEGVPQVLLDGMAMGKPIVTTNNVGCRETVDDGKNGYLIPVKDSNALANALDDLLLDDKKRVEFGRQSLLKVKQEFDQKLIVEKMLNDFYQLLPHKLNVRLH